MIILKKKRIIFLISALMISLIAIDINSNVFGEIGDNINYTIILDSGHGQPDRWSYK